MTSPGRHLLDGVVRLLAAEILLPVSGIVTAAVLARELRASGYGVFVLAVALVGWTEWMLSALFARAAIALASRDPGGLAETVVRLHLKAGLVALLVVSAAAWPIASTLQEPALAPALWLFALDLPVFALAQGHAAMLIARGRYRERARARAARWLGRLILVSALVASGFGVTGAVLGCIGASAVELVVARRSEAPRLLGSVARAPQEIWGYALPTFLAALGLRLLSLDIVALKALGASTAEAGLYGAAQSVALLPGILTLALVPPLLGTLSRLRTAGDDAGARGLGSEALRAVMLLAPFLAAPAAAAPELMELVFGASFRGAAASVPPLLVGGLALALINVATAILTAAARPGLTLLLCAPLPVFAAVGYVTLIPRLGAPGAALGTALAAVSGAMAALLAASRIAGAAVRHTTLLRTAAATVLVYALATRLPTAGVLVIPKLLALGVAALVALALLRELGAAEGHAARAVLRGLLGGSR